MSESSELCTVGDHPFEVLFHAPLHVSCWIDDKTVVVGGGGGETKFGMKNFLQLIVVDENKSKWKAVAQLNFGETAAWCISELQGTGGKYVLLVSHVDSMSVVDVSVNHSTQSFVLHQREQLKLVTDSQNPDKKPVAATSKGFAFVAQDDETVSILKVNPVLKPVSILKQEADNTLWKGRIRSLVSTSIGDRTLIASVSEDKCFRVILVDAQAMPTAVKCLGETDLNLGFRLMKSSLRSAIFLPNEKQCIVILNAFDSDSTTTHLITFNVKVSAEDKRGGLAVDTLGRFQLPREVITAMSQVPQTSGSLHPRLLCATVEGSLVELECTTDGTVSLLRSKKAAHTEPISSVSISTLGLAVSTDIGQRAHLWRIGGTNTAIPQLFSKRPLSWRVTFLLVSLLFAVIAVLLRMQLGLEW